MSNPILKFKPLANARELGRQASADPWHMGGTLVVVQDVLQQERIGIAVQDGEADHSVRRDEIRLTVVGWDQILMLRDALNAALSGSPTLPTRGK
jgi:hypothetical protein